MSPSSTKNSPQSSSLSRRSLLITSPTTPSTTTAINTSIDSTDSKTSGSYSNSTVSSSDGGDGNAHESVISELHKLLVGGKGEGTVSRYASCWMSLTFLYSFRRCRSFVKYYSCVLFFLMMLRSVFHLLFFSFKTYLS